MTESRTEDHPGANMMAPHAAACSSSDAATGSILNVSSRSVIDIRALARLPGEEIDGRRAVDITGGTIDEAG